MSIMDHPRSSLKNKTKRTHTKKQQHNNNNKSILYPFTYIKKIYKKIQECPYLCESIYGQTKNEHLPKTNKKNNHQVSTMALSNPLPPDSPRGPRACDSSNCLFIFSAVLQAAENTSHTTTHSLCPPAPQTPAASNRRGKSQMADRELRFQTTANQTCGKWL